MTPDDPAPPFSPLIPATAVMREFTARAVITGALLGLVFGASSLYLTLKVGLAVSPSIPIAVISLTLFRALSKCGLRDATILEHNLVQTGGSAGESIAFGLGITMPAILLLGFDIDLMLATAVALLGALLGILMMIPLRRTLIVAEHGTLKYPEGTACAALLAAGANPADRAAMAPAADSATTGAPGGTVIFAGFLIGLVYKLANTALRGWREIVGHVFGAPWRGASVSLEVSPELLGIGYIIGPRTASIMCAGGVFAYLLLIPLIKFFGELIPAPLAPGRIPISDMTPADIRSAYILYIGAGGVAAGGIFSLVRSLPTIARGLKAGLRGLGAARSTVAGDRDTPRTDQELPLRLVLAGIILVIAGVVAVPALHMNLLGALLVVVFGFLFVTVASRLCGEIGSSANPVSGMTVATLIVTCVIFLGLGWTGRTHYVTALAVGAIVCIAATNAGGTSQDLKTGFLLGATPRHQQIAILIGAALSAVLLGPILLRLNDAATVYVPAAQVASAGLRLDVTTLPRTEELHGPQRRDDAHRYHVWQKPDAIDGRPGRYLVDDTGRPVWYVDPGINGTFTQRPDGSPVRKFDAPKATLASYIIKGILDRKLPWALVLFGATIAVVMEMCGLPSLVFAVGVYLPLSSSCPIWIGGILRWLFDRRQRARQPASSAAQLAELGDKSPGVLLASGYIAGGAIAGIGTAFFANALAPADAAIAAWAGLHNPFFSGPHAAAWSLLPFAALLLVLHLVNCGKFFASGRR